MKIVIQIGTRSVQILCYNMNMKDLVPQSLSSLQKHQKGYEYK